MENKSRDQLLELIKQLEENIKDERECHKQIQKAYAIEIKELSNKLLCQKNMFMGRIKQLEEEYACLSLDTKRRNDEN